MRRMSGLVGAVVAMLIQQSAFAADLSPARWPASERERLERLELSPFPPAARTIEGRSELVSATMSPIAVNTGMEALRQGGNAADAAITTALSQVATNLGAVVSYAGVAELVYFEAKTGKVYALDAGWAAYADELDPASIAQADLSAIVQGRVGTAGAQGRKTLTPGFMAGMEAAHRRFGRLPFAELFQPAIWYARNGVTVSPLLGAYFAMEQDKLARTEEGRQFLGQAGNDLPKAGDRFRQPKLADFLEAVATKGSAHMYRGPWAREFVKIVRREGGAVTMDDLQRYRPAWETPLSVTYGDAQVFAPGSTNVGGCTILEALNLLDAAGVREMGPYWTDANAFAVYTRILRFAAFGHKPASTCESRLGKDYARIAVSQIEALSRRPSSGEAGHHSDSVVVVDRWGNVAVLLHSINSLMWGETGIVVGGIPIGGPAGIYQSRLAGVPRGGRLPSDMAPVLALRNGKPVLGVSSVGTATAAETVRLTAGLLEDDADAHALVAAPPLLLNFEALASGIPLAEQPALIPAGAYSAEWRAALQAAGVKLTDADVAHAAALRGTAALGIIGPTGARSTIENPSVLTFGQAR